MRYLITKDKITHLIYNYIDGEFSEEKNDDVQFTWTRVGGGKSGIATFMKDYEYIFIYIQKKYFNGLSQGDNEKSKQVFLSRAKQAPILEFEDCLFYENLNHIFGNYWKPVFENWFQNTYNLPVKTFIYP